MMRKSYAYTKKDKKIVKKGIVLLSSVLLIIALSVIVLEGTKISQKYFSQSSRNLFLAQANKTFLDVLEFLKFSTSMIENASAFKEIEGLPIVIDDKINLLQTVFLLESGASKININTLLQKNDNEHKINQSLYDFLNYLMIKNRVIDPNFFISILLDAIDDDSEERAYESELALYSRSFKDGQIGSLEVFKQLQNYYAKKRDDLQIYDIEWEKIIDFSDHKVDFNYINENLKNYLVEQFSVNVYINSGIIESEDDLRLNGEAKEVFKELQIEYYVPLFKCTMIFTKENNKADIEFFYEIPTKNIFNIKTLF